MDAAYLRTLEGAFLAYPFARFWRHLMGRWREGETYWLKHWKNCCLLRLCRHSVGLQVELNLEIGTRGLLKVSPYAGDYSFKSRDVASGMAGAIPMPLAIPIFQIFCSKALPISYFMFTGCGSPTQILLPATHCLKHTSCFNLTTEEYSILSIFDLFKRFIP